MPKGNDQTLAGLSNNAKSQLAETEKINKVRKRQTETNVIGNLPLFVNQTDEI